MSVNRLVCSSRQRKTAAARGCTWLHAAQHHALCSRRGGGGTSTCSGASLEEAAAACCSRRCALCSLSFPHTRLCKQAYSLANACTYAAVFFAQPCTRQTAGGRAHAGGARLWQRHLASAPPSVFLSSGHTLHRVQPTPHHCDLGKRALVRRRVVRCAQPPAMASRKGAAAVAEFTGHVRRWEKRRVPVGARLRSGARFL